MLRKLLLVGFVLMLSVGASIGLITKTKVKTQTTTGEIDMTRSRVVMAYALDGYGSDESIAKFSSNMNMVTTVSYTLGVNGTLVGTTPIKQVAALNADGKSTIMLVSNYNETFEGGWDYDLIGEMLTHDTIRTTFINNLISTAKKGNFKGINIDFEAVPYIYRTYLNDFMANLRAATEANNLKVIISVPAKTADLATDNWFGAFEYKTLAKYVDYMQLMTYDEHGSWSAPGSVSSIEWVKATVAYAVSEVTPSKLLLGIPSYGYDWNLDNPDLNTSVAGKDIYNKPHTVDKATQSSYYKYKDANRNNHIVWFEDKNNVQTKVSLVKTYNLAGVAIWRLGTENADFWEGVNAGLK